jgi:hypothetical protein
MINVKPFHCRTFQQHCCKFPEDGKSAEKCRGNLIVKYTIQYSAFVGAYRVGDSPLHTTHVVRFTASLDILPQIAARKQ